MFNKFKTFLDWLVIFAIGPYAMRITLSSQNKVNTFTQSQVIRTQFVTSYMTYVRINHE